jgi:penicillin-binding protein 2
MQWGEKSSMRQAGPTRLGAKRTQPLPRPGATGGFEPARLGLILLIIAICLATLVGGLAWRQLVQKDAFLAAEERQNYRRILMPGPRGNIYDRHDRLLVGNRPLFSAVVYLNELRGEFRREFIRLLNEYRERGMQPDRRALSIEARTRVVQYYQNRLNAILGRRDTIDSNRVERHFSQSLLLPFPLLRDIDSTAYARLIEQLPVSSPVQVIADTARYYPYGDAACHVIGFVSDNQDISADDVPGDTILTFRFVGKVGRSGLESKFDAHLQGRTGGEIWSVDPSGFQYERMVHEQPERGLDLYTTLDIAVQQTAEQALGNKTGAVALIDIASGEVRALASRPGYDLNDLSPFIPYQVDARIREAGAWLNRATQGLYPPGSAFKLVTALAGLRAGTIDPLATVVVCPGFHAVGRRIFRCNRRAGHGPEELLGAIRDSCNVFFYDRGIATGVERIAAEARFFHLHEPTGIELPGETRSMLVPDPAWKRRRLHGEAWFEGDTANLTIGQGFLLVTPLQMAAMTAGIARGDAGPRPTLLSRHPDNPASPQPPRPAQPIDLPAVALDTLRAGMIAAAETGTARQATPRGSSVAGKTGTAQVRKDGRPTTIAWFVGYAPADNPRFAICVMIEGAPANEAEYGGGSTAAPIARAVFTQALTDN